MAAKSIIAGEYILQIADNGHVDVVRVFRNAMKTMKDIATGINFPVEEKWNTQDLGRHLVKEFGDGKTAKFDDITINKMADGKIEIYQECKNTLDALRIISKQVGFVLEEKWNTQTAGAKVAAYLEEHKEEADKILQTPNERSKAVHINMERKSPSCETKTIHISIGGNSGKAVEFMGCMQEHTQRYEELKDNDDVDELRDYIAERYDESPFDMFWYIQPYDDECQVSVEVTDQSGNQLFDDMMTYEENLGDPRNWQCHHRMPSCIKEILESRISQAIEEYADDEETLISETAYLVGWSTVFGEIRRLYNAYNMEESESAQCVVSSHNMEEFKMQFDIEIPKDEEFDANKLSLFNCDFDGVDTDGCQDSVAQIIKYGNTLYFGYVDDCFDHINDQYGFAEFIGEEVASDGISYEGGNL